MKTELLPGVSDELLEKYYSTIQPNQQYMDWQQQASGIWIPLRLEGPSAGDLARFGFDADENSSSNKWSALVKSASQSRVLKVAAAFGAFFVGANALLEDSRSSEASALNPQLLNGDDNSPNVDYINPEETEVTDLNQAQINLNLLHGDGSQARLNIMLLPYNGTTTQMLQEVAQDIFLIPPTNEFKDRVNVYTKTPLENLNCDQNANCDLSAIQREINRVVGTGLIPHETLVVIKNNDVGGGAGLATMTGRFSPPDIYTHSQVVRSEVIREGFREFYAAGVAHELWGHAFAGFDHEGGDIMDNSIQGSARLQFNSQHAQFLRAHMALAPHNYLTPKNEIRTMAASLGFKSELITPTGTTQQKRLITPFNNDGPGVELIRGPESSFTVPAPPQWYGLLPDMTYTWTEYSSGLTIPLLKDDQRWTQVEGWPGVMFPNPPAEIKIKTAKRDSSGITTVSPKNGEVISDLRSALRWANRDLDVFYYEVRASKDCTFNTDPQTATAPIWHNLIHGGETKPINSWPTPQLELNTEYCWETRPRIQGDGTPVEWSQTFRFRTPTVDARTKTY